MIIHNQITTELTFRPVFPAYAPFHNLIGAFFLFAYSDFRLCPVPFTYSSLDRTIHASFNIADLFRWFSSVTITDSSLHGFLGASFLTASFTHTQFPMIFGSMNPTDSSTSPQCLFSASLDGAIVHIFPAGMF